MWRGEYLLRNTHYITVRRRIRHLLFLKLVRWLLSKMKGYLDEWKLGRIERLIISNINMLYPLELYDGHIEISVDKVKGEIKSQDAGHTENNDSKDSLRAPTRQ